MMTTSRMMGIFRSDERSRREVVRRAIGRTTGSREDGPEIFGDFRGAVAREYGLHRSFGVVDAGEAEGLPLRDALFAEPRLTKSFGRPRQELTRTSMHVRCPSETRQATRDLRRVD